MFKSQGGKFSSVFGTRKTNQETPFHTENSASRKLLKHDLTACHGTYCQEEEAPAFSS